MLKNKRNIFLCVLTVIVVTLVLFTAFCTYWDIYYAVKTYDQVFVDGCNISYNTLTHKAYAEICTVDENHTVTVPDEVNGCKVTSLGGIPSCGEVHSFSVVPDIEIPEGVTATSYTFDVADAFDTEYDTYTVNLKLGKNIDKITGFIGRIAWVGDIITVDEHEVRDVVMRFVFNIEVSPENETFYSENGRLYYKKTGEIVDGIDYGD